jgi:hypothetical protein
VAAALAACGRTTTCSKHPLRKYFENWFCLFVILITTKLLSLLLLQQHFQLVALLLPAQDEICNAGIGDNRTGWEVLAKSLGHRSRRVRGNTTFAAKRMCVQVDVGPPFGKCLQVGVAKGASIHQAVRSSLTKHGLPFAAWEFITLHLDGSPLGDATANTDNDQATVRVMWRGCLGGAKKRMTEDNSRHCKETRAKAAAKAMASSAAGSLSIASMFQASSQSSTVSAAASALPQPQDVRPAAHIDLGESLRQSVETAAGLSEEETQAEAPKLGSSSGCAKKRAPEANALHCKEKRSKTAAKAMARSAEGSLHIDSMFKAQPSSSAAPTSLRQEGGHCLRVPEGADSVTDLEPIQRGARRAESKQRYYEEHATKLKAARMDRYEANAEEERAARMDRYGANADEERAARMDRYEANAEEERAARKERYAANPAPDKDRDAARRENKQTARAAHTALADERRQAEMLQTWALAKSWADGQGLPPCFGNLQDRACHEWVSELYNFFEDCEVRACSSCKERWFQVPASVSSFGWGARASKILGAPAGGPDFKATGGGLGDVLCETCANPVTATVLTAANNMDLGGPVPAELAVLTDFEEMLVSRIHPLVQVFTLFPSGQMAYVGHIVNYRQRSVKWITDLPLRPADVPIVLVRRKTRETAKRQRARVPFAARKEVLRNALVWLLANHPQWQPGVHGNTQLKEEHLQEYSDDGVVLNIPAHEIDGPSEIDVPRELFANWVVNPSYKFASALRRILEASEETSGNNLWDLCRQKIAEASGVQRYRAAETLPSMVVTALLADHGALEARPDGSEDPSNDEQVLIAELSAEMENMGEREPVQDAGSIEGVGLEGDEHIRLAAVEELAEAAGLDSDKDVAQQEEAGEVSSKGEAAAGHTVGAEAPAADADLHVDAEMRRKAPRALTQLDG